MEFLAKSFKDDVKNSLAKTPGDHSEVVDFITKECSMCLQLKEISCFYAGKKKISQCKEYVRQANRNWHANNRENVAKRNKTYRNNNKEKIIQRSKMYRDNNKEKVRASELKCVKNRIQKDEVFHMQYKIRRLIKGYLSKKGVVKNSKTTDILGCSFDVFFTHLIQTAVDNYGFYSKMSDYHIDHIIPLSSAKTSLDVISLNHYSNLQLLTPTDNLFKGNKILNGQ